jgi:hypothetical protein
MTYIRSIIAFASILPFVAFGQDYTGPRLANPVARIMEPQNLIDLLVTIFQFLGGPVVVIGVIYAGFLLVTAQGDEKKIEHGRAVLLWTIVGAAIILGASVIKSVVEGTIEGLQ